MTVKKTSAGTWEARYPIGGGKYKTKTFAKKTDAEDFKAGMRSVVKGGDYVDPNAGKRLVSEVAWAWFEMMPDTPNYRQNVRSHIKNHLVPELGSRPIGTVTHRDLQRLVNRLNRTHVPSSVSTIMTSIKSVFASAAKEKIIPDNPAIDLKLAKTEKKQVKPLRVEQIHAIADCIFPRYRALVLFTAGTGMRQGEAFGVRVTDVEWERGNGSVTIRHQVQSYTAHPQEVVPTKTREGRTVPIGDDLLDLLEKHIVDYPPNRDGFIFTNSEDRPIHRRPFDRAYLTAREKAAEAQRAAAESEVADTPRMLALALGVAAELQSSTFHSLRHFYASLLIRGGLNPRVVAERLGHANVTMTLSRYAHLWEDDGDRTRDASNILFRR